MRPQHYPGIRLHLGYFRAGDDEQPSGEMRARLEGAEPWSAENAPAGFGDCTVEVSRHSRVDIHTEN